MKKNNLIEIDQSLSWHPFTQMQDWIKEKPTFITSGKQAVLKDAEGNEYIDANASIWTNTHGHGNKQIDRAIKKQLKRLAHTSYLGLANIPATLLMEKLIRLSKLPENKTPATAKEPDLKRVFFSDDGSTALEVALKMSFEYARRARGALKPRYLSLNQAYHGDTIGAVSLGKIDLFHSSFKDLLFQSDKVMAPFCYRCPFNKAEPERMQSTSYRKCRWECVHQVEKKVASARRSSRPVTAMVVEPLIQGVAGMVVHPSGWLKKVATILRAESIQLIADEVMTGFGRTGGKSLFACHEEGVQPDFMALAKGLTGGYLPLAATLTTESVFEAFLGRYDEFKTFFHGHSYTANPLGCAAAVENLKLLEDSKATEKRREKARHLKKVIQLLWRHGQVGDIRQIGLIAGVELVKDWHTREAFHWAEQRGMKVCGRLKLKGVLTRPIGNVIVLMFPYCITKKQITDTVARLDEAIAEEFHPTR